MESILQVNHLKKVFHQRGKGDIPAVNDVSFCLYPGEILGIVGESGSGKSTVAKLITRLTDASEGEIILDGQSITHLKGTALKEAYGKIQMVFQNPVGSFDPRRTLGDGIGESLRNQGLPKVEIRKKVSELLEQCGLDASYADRYPHQVSGGQCQRAAIARALAVEPKVLICDEATSALDPQTTGAILQLLKHLNKKLGITIVIITHEMAVVKEICDRVAVMEHGNVVEEGDVFSIFAAPKAGITRDFIRTTSNLQKIEKLIEDKSPLVELKPGEKILRLNYIKKNTSEALISETSRKFNINLNIIFADLEIVQDAPIGGTVAIASGRKEDIEGAVEYLKAKNVGVEVIENG